ncbi:MAG: hypothetical protein KAT32_00360 [Candidatus Moranbacteria bacterium]|nr:hypothetical protein [Candidatus Moranbacteria bacterium]
MILTNKVVFKTVLTLFGFFLALFGLIGFVSNSFQGRSHEITKTPLNGKNGVVVDSNGNYFVFNKGSLISQEKEFNQKELQLKYHMTQKNYFKTDNKIYSVTPFNTVLIKDKLSSKTEKIHLNAPIWPFSIAIFWLIFASGMVLIFITHRKLFVSMNKWKK